MEELNNFYKNNETDKIFWVDNVEDVGVWLFSFDKEKIFNMFEDYPQELTKDQKEIFDKEIGGRLIIFTSRQ